MGFVVLETKEQLQAVLLDLEKHRPKAQQLESLVRNTLSGKYAWPGIEYVVDAFPNWQAIVCRPAKNSPIYRNRVCRNSVNIFATNSEALGRLLQQPEIIDWQQSTHFIALPKPEIYETTRDRCLQLNPVLEWGSYENARVFLLKPDRIVNRDLPEGPYRLGELRGPQHAAIVQANWDWSDEESLPYFEYLLSDECQLPNSAVFDTTTNTPVAHILYTGDGSMGIGWVHPDYRNKGLYQVVNYDLCRKIFAMGHEVAFAFAADDNVASTRSFMRMGAEECDFRVDWLTAAPAAQ